MINKMRRVTREPMSIPLPIPGLRPYPLIDEWAIREVRIVSIQYAIDPPAHRPIPARWARARLHINLDPIPGARNDRRRGDVWIAMVLVWRSKALIEIVRELRGPIEKLIRARVCAEIEDAVLPTLCPADEKSLVCVHLIAGKFWISPPPKSDVDFLDIRWRVVVQLRSSATSDIVSLRFQHTWWTDWSCYVRDDTERIRRWRTGKCVRTVVWILQLAIACRMIESTVE